MLLTALMQNPRTAAMLPNLVETPLAGDLGDEGRRRLVRAIRCFDFFHTQETIMNTAAIVVEDQAFEKAAAQAQSLLENQYRGGIEFEVPREWVMRASAGGSSTELMLHEGKWSAEQLQAFTEFCRAKTTLNTPDLQQAQLEAWEYTRGSITVLGNDRKKAPFGRVINQHFEYEMNALDSMGISDGIPAGFFQGDSFDFDLRINPFANNWFASAVSSFEYACDRLIPAVEHFEDLVGLMGDVSDFLESPLSPEAGGSVRSLPSLSNTEIGL